MIAVAVQTGNGHAPNVALSSDRAEHVRNRLPGSRGDYTATALCPARALVRIVRM